MCHFAIRPFIKDANCAKCATQILEMSLSDITELRLHNPLADAFTASGSHTFVALHCD